MRSSWYAPSGALATPPALPAGYLTDGATYYDINTSAVFGEPVTLCIPYSGIADGARLLHHDGSEWVDVTLSDAGGVLCAEIGSLSPFAVVDSMPAAVPTTTIQSAPPANHVSPTATFALVSQPLTSIMALGSAGIRSVGQAVDFVLAELRWRRPVRTPAAEPVMASSVA